MLGFISLLSDSHGPLVSMAHLMRHPLSQLCKCSSLATLDADLHESFLVLEEAARQNAAGAGAKDLQRLQLQNASLKGSAMHMRVREEFLDALASGGLPLGNEAACRAALQVCQQ